MATLAVLGCDYEPPRIRKGTISRSSSLQTGRLEVLLSQGLSLTRSLVRGAL